MNAVEQFKDHFQPGAVYRRADLVADYADEVGPSYWEDFPDETPEDSAESDMDYWGARMSAAIPETVLFAAFDLVEAMQSNKMDALTASDTRYISMLTDDANAIARALMTAAKEADEAATKRERERCISVVRGISDRHTLDASSCHLDGEKDAAALASYCARSIDDIAAILKGAT